MIWRSSVPAFIHSDHNYKAWVVICLHPLVNYTYHWANFQETYTCKLTVENSWISWKSIRWFSHWYWVTEDLYGLQHEDSYFTVWRMHDNVKKFFF